MILESLLTLALAVPPVGAPDVPEARPATVEAAQVTLIHERAAQYGVSGAWLESTLRCESRLNPNAIGAAGEQGAAQLHGRGLRPVFFQRGFTDPFDFDQAVTFTAQMFAEGQARHWTCSRRAR